MYLRRRLLACFALLVGLICVAQTDSYGGRPQLMGAGVNVASGGGGCSQATTFLARTSGLDGTHTTAYTNLICGLVTDGNWSKFDILYIFATQDQTTALLNLPNNTYAATNAAVLTFTADLGFTGSGSSGGYIDLGFNPTGGSPQYVQNSAHYSFWNLTNATVTNTDWGNTTVDVGTNGYAKFSDNNLYLRLNDLAASGGFAISDPRGHILANRSSSTARQGYQNGSTTLNGGTSVSYGSTTSTTVPNANFSIMGNTVGGNTHQMAEASAGSSLDATAAPQVYNRFRTYMTAVGVP